MRIEGAFDSDHVKQEKNRTGLQPTSTWKHTRYVTWHRCRLQTCSVFFLLEVGLGPGLGSGLLAV